MLGQRQKNSSRRITVGADKAYEAKSLHRRNACSERYRTCAEERQGAPLEPGRENQPGTPATPPLLAAAGLIEKTFGWLKQTGPLAQVKLRGRAKECSTGNSKTPTSP